MLTSFFCLYSSVTVMQHLAVQIEFLDNIKEAQRRKFCIVFITFCCISEKQYNESKEKVQAQEQEISTSRTQQVENCFLSLVHVAI